MSNEADFKCEDLFPHVHLLSSFVQLVILFLMLFDASQAQRDYFGAHTYELLSKPGVFIHTNWTGHGGNVSSSSYSV